MNGLINALLLGGVVWYASVFLSTESILTLGGYGLGLAIVWVHLRAIFDTLRG